MNDDVSIGLLEIIQKSFNLDYSQSSKIESCLKKLEQKKVDYATAQEYAIEVGEILAKTFGNIQSSDLPNEKMYYNIAKKLIEPTLIKNYELINDYSTQVQALLNESANVGLAVVSSKINQEQIEGIVNKISSAERYDDVSWMLKDPIVQFTQNVVDRTIKANSDMHYSAGRAATIKRKVFGKACPWCMKLAGVYNYPDVPEDVYRRHNNCRCQVIYDPKDRSRKQDVHDKKRILEEDIDKELLKEYSNTPTKTLKDIWRSGIETGWMSALVNYEDFVETYYQLYSSLVGERTKDCIEIKSISEHFMYRLFGTLVDPKIYKEEHKIIRRPGVEVENAIDALLYGESTPVVYDDEGKPSKVYFNNRCKVSMNPDTGNLIQCNPSSRKWKVKK